MKRTKDKIRIKCSFLKTNIHFIKTKTKNENLNTLHNFNSSLLSCPCCVEGIISFSFVVTSLLFESHCLRFRPVRSCDRHNARSPLLHRRLHCLISNARNRPETRRVPIQLRLGFLHVAQNREVREMPRRPLLFRRRHRRRIERSEGKHHVDLAMRA